MSNEALNQPELLITNLKKAHEQLASNPEGYDEKIVEVLQEALESPNLGEHQDRIQGALAGLEAGEFNPYALRGIIQKVLDSMNIEDVDEAPAENTEPSYETGEVSIYAGVPAGKAGISKAFTESPQDPDKKRLVMTNNGDVFINKDVPNNLQDLVNTLDSSFFNLQGISDLRGTDLGDVIILSPGKGVMVGDGKAFRIIEKITLGLRTATEASEKKVSAPENREGFKTIYAGPALNGVFIQRTLSEAPKNTHPAQLEINGNTGEISVDPSSEAFERATKIPDTFLTGWTKWNGDPKNPVTSIEKGVIKKESSGWKVIKPVTIYFGEPTPPAGSQQPEVEQPSDNSEGEKIEEVVAEEVPVVIEELTKKEEGDHIFSQLAANSEEREAFDLDAEDMTEVEKLLVEEFEGHKAEIDSVIERDDSTPKGMLGKKPGDIFSDMLFITPALTQMRQILDSINNESVKAQLRKEYSKYIEKIKKAIDRHKRHLSEEQQSQFAGERIEDPYGEAEDPEDEQNEKEAAAAEELLVEEFEGHKKQIDFLIENDQYSPEGMLSRVGEIDDITLATDYYGKMIQTLNKVERTPRNKTLLQELEQGLTAYSKKIDEATKRYEDFISGETQPTETSEGSSESEETEIGSPGTPGEIKRARNILRIEEITQEEAPQTEKAPASKSVLTLMKNIVLNKNEVDEARKRAEEGLSEREKDLGITQILESDEELKEYREALKQSRTTYMQALMEGEAEIKKLRKSLDKAKKTNQNETLTAISTENIEFKIKTKEKIIANQKKIYQNNLQLVALQEKGLRQSVNQSAADIAYRTFENKIIKEQEALKKARLEKSSLVRKVLAKYSSLSWGKKRIISALIMGGATVASGGAGALVVVTKFAIGSVVGLGNEALLQKYDLDTKEAEEQAGYYALQQGMEAESEEDETADEIFERLQTLYTERQEELKKVKDENKGRTYARLARIAVGVGLFAGGMAYNDLTSDVAELAAEAGADQAPNVNPTEPGRVDNADGAEKGGSSGVFEEIKNLTEDLSTRIGGVLRDNLSLRADAVVEAEVADSIDAGDVAEAGAAETNDANAGASSEGDIEQPPANGEVGQVEEVEEAAGQEERMSSEELNRLEEQEGAKIKKEEAAREAARRVAEAGEVNNVGDVAEAGAAETNDANAGASSEGDIEQPPANGEVGQVEVADKTVELAKLPPEAIVQKGDGISQIIQRQLDADEFLMYQVYDALRDFNGEMGSPEMYRELMEKYGYMTADGKEIRISADMIGKGGYQIIVEDGAIKIHEINLAGTEQHVAETAFEGKDFDKGEYLFGGEKQVSVAKEAADSWGGDFTEAEKSTPIQSIIGDEIEKAVLSTIDKSAVDLTDPGLDLQGNTDIPATGGMLDLTKPNLQIIEQPDQVSIYAEEIAKNTDMSPEDVQSWYQDAVDSYQEGKRSPLNKEVSRVLQGKDFRDPIKGIKIDLERLEHPRDASAQWAAMSNKHIPKNFFSLSMPQNILDDPTKLEASLVEQMGIVDGEGLSSDQITMIQNLRLAYGGLIQEIMDADTNLQTMEQLMATIKEARAEDLVTKVMQDTATSGGTLPKIKN